MKMGQLTQKNMATFKTLIDGAGMFQFYVDRLRTFLIFNHLHVCLGTLCVSVEESSVEKIGQNFKILIIAVPDLYTNGQFVNSGKLVMFQNTRSI